MESRRRRSSSASWRRSATAVLQIGDHGSTEMRREPAAAPSLVVTVRSIACREPRLPHGGQLRAVSDRRMFSPRCTGAGARHRQDRNRHYGRPFNTPAGCRSTGMTRSVRAQWDAVRAKICRGIRAACAAWCVRQGPPACRRPAGRGGSGRLAGSCAQWCSNRKASNEWTAGGEEVGTEPHWLGPSTSRRPWPTTCASDWFRAQRRCGSAGPRRACDGSGLSKRMPVVSSSSTKTSSLSVRACSKPRMARAGTRVGVANLVNGR